MNAIRKSIEALIRRFKMDWDAGRPIPVPIREDQKPPENHRRNYPKK
ncbi:hypothetical protein HQ585_16805 [candidate division KSB1 bacterium]|nr:hypothetical protein [candidate division KSB1 bacterium]